MIKNGKLTLPKSYIQEAFEKCDIGQKSYLTNVECQDLQEMLVNKYKFDRDRLQEVLSDLKTQNTIRATLTDITTRVEPQVSRSAFTSPQNSQRSTRFGISTSEQLIPAARIIFVLQLIKKKHDIEKSLLSEIDWCIEQLAIGNIYETLTISNYGTDPPQLPKRSEAMPWLAQYSTPNVSMEEIQSYLNETAAQVASKSDQQIARNIQERQKRRSFMAQDIVTDIEKLQEFLKTVRSINFSVLDAEKVIGRDKVLPLIAFHIFQQHNIFETTPIDENAFVSFVSHIRKGYVKENPYHNDLHAADVLQMCHFMVSTGGIQKAAKLNQMDVAALLLSAIVHDYKHPGVTNGFLQNSSNDLAIAYNDKAILESYHVSEAYKLIQKDKDCNLFKNLTTAEKAYMRKRIIGCVLSTDMAAHNELNNKLQTLIRVHGIRKGKNSEKLINPKTEFESKQYILELCIHTADCGNTSREFNLHKELVIRLLEEFGRQGDIEKSMKLPISFLCDRTTVNLPVSQIGYINNLTRPMVSKFVEVFPGCSALLTNADRNEREWRKLETKNS